MEIDWKNLSIVKVVVPAGDDLVVIIEEKNSALFSWSIRTAEGQLIVNGGATSMDAAKRLCDRAIREHYKKADQKGVGEPDQCQNT